MGDSETFGRCHFWVELPSTWIFSWVDFSRLTCCGIPSARRFAAPSPLCYTRLRSKVNEDRLPTTDMPNADTPTPNHIEEDKHWWFASRAWALHTLMRQTLPSVKGLYVLDVGCGAGNMMHHLSRYGRVKGIDIDPRPVEQARLRGYDVDQADATQLLPFDDDTFDLVTTLDVLEHVDQDAAILQEAHRTLKPGGHIVTTVPAFAWLWSHNDDINGHKRRYTAKELQTKLRQAGFAVKRLSFNNFFIFPVAATFILLRRGHEPELASHHLQEDEYQVEMEPVSPLLNTILTIVGQLEAALIKWVSFPYGTCLILIAQKPK